MRAYHPQPTVAQHAFPESRIPPVRHSRRKKDTRRSKSGMGLICSFSGWVLSPNERRAIHLYGGIYKHFMFTWASQVAFSGKESICKQVTQIRSLGWENPLEKEMETHSSILAWRFPRTEEPCGLQSMGSQKIGHDWSHLAHFLVHLIFSTVRLSLDFAALFIDEKTEFWD